MSITKSREHEKHKRERGAVYWSFIISIALTICAFIAVGTNVIENRVTLLLFLFTLALLQVFVQLFYFMHLKDKGHRLPLIFAFSSFFVAIVLVYGIVEWLW